MNNFPKKLHELKQEKHAKLDLIKNIEEPIEERGTKMTSTEQNLIERYKSDLSTLDELIKIREEHEERAKLNGKIIPMGGRKTQTEEFRNMLDECINSNERKTFEYKSEFRSDPLQTSDDPDILNKTVAPISLMGNPYENMLRGLGIKFYEGLNSQLVLPILPEVMAKFVNEGQDASTADMATASTVLSAKRVSHTQTISKETIVQTNDVLKGVLDNLVLGIWKSIAFRFFDNLDASAATQIGTPVGPVSFINITNLEASLGNVALTNPKYVMKPETKAFLKRTRKFEGSTEAIWEDDKVNEYAAFATPAVNDERIIFGDFSKGAIGQWGPASIEVIIDPYTKAVKGEIVLTAVGLFECGVVNKLGFAIIADASTF